MPTASDKLRNKMQQYFGDPISDGPPTKFLEGAGYKLTDAWEWIAPKTIKNYDTMSEKEYDCISFLIQEWDYGGALFNVEDESKVQKRTA